MSDALLGFRLSRPLTDPNELESARVALGVDENRAFVAGIVPELHWSGATSGWYQADDGSRLEISVHDGFVAAKVWGRTQGAFEGLAVTAFRRLAAAPNWIFYDPTTGGFVRPDES